MSSKLGIITYCQLNYGSTLQAYAMLEATRQLGYQSEIIDYVRYKSFLQRWVYRVKKLPDMLRTPGQIQVYFDRRNRKKNAEKRRILFQTFHREYLKFSELRFKNFEDLHADADRYDVCVCGSDQIWNPLVYKNNSIYYLQFVPEFKRVAYAPSIGISEIPHCYRKRMAELLLGIPHLSVREKTGVEIVHELTGRTAKHVLDPTLLLDEEYWKPLARNSCVPDEPYILCYFLEDDYYMRERVLQIAQKSGMRVLALPFSHLDILETRFEQCFDVGPAEFLGLIKNAALVCTDSFHGTAFSLNLQRPFLAFRREKKCPEALTASRISGLLDMFALQNRGINSGSSLPEQPCELDYSKTLSVLEEKRQDSLDYLRTSLQTVVEGRGKRV